MILAAAAFATLTATGFFMDRGKPFESMHMAEWARFVVCIAIATPLCAVVLNDLYVYAERLGARYATGSSDAITWRRWLFASLVIFACWIPVWLAYYPGMWNYDPWQVEQVMRAEYDAGNPLIHTILLGVCYGIGALSDSPNAGLILYEIIQMAAMACIFGYTYCYICRKTNNRWIRLIALLFYGALPINSIFAVSTTKDVIFSGLFLLCFVWTLQFIDGNKPASTLSVAMRAALCVLMMLYRHNAILGMALLILFGVFARKKYQISKRNIALMCMTVALYYLFTFAITKGLQPQAARASEPLSFSSQQFGRILTYGEEEDKETVWKYFNEDAYYTPFLADSMKYAYKEENRLTEHLKDSARFCVKYPALTLDSLLYTTEGYWYIEDRSHAIIYGVEGGMGYMQTKSYGMFGITPESKLPKLKEAYEYLFTENHYLDLPVLRVVYFPAFHTWVLVFCTIGWRAYKRRRHSLSLVFLWAYYLPLLLSPCVLIRYVYPIMVCCPVLLILLLHFAGQNRTAAETLKEEPLHAQD